MMTIDDIIAYAAAHGYDFGTVSRACATLVDDQRAGDDVWSARGARAILDAHAPRREFTADEISHAQYHSVRV